MENKSSIVSNISHCMAQLYRRLHSYMVMAYNLLYNAFAKFAGIDCSVNVDRNLSSARLHFFHLFLIWWNKCIVNMQMGNFVPWFSQILERKYYFQIIFLHFSVIWSRWSTSRPARSRLKRRNRKTTRKTSIRTSARVRFDERRGIFYYAASSLF